jgi:hypothetical protein
VIAHSIGILLSQRIRVDVRAIPDRRPDLTIVSIPPVCTHTGIRELRRAASLIDKARDQTRKFLAGKPCHHCGHDGAQKLPLQEEGVRRLGTGIDVA